MGEDGLAGVAQDCKIARHEILAVDGRSSSGKTILAARVQAAVTRSAVVHTDDLAWWHSRFGWADLLIDGILMPVHPKPACIVPAAELG